MERLVSMNPRRCIVIAEAGVNHNGSIELALRLVDAAAEAGADAVKFQTFRAERLVTAEAGKAAYQKAATGEGESQLEMLRRLELDESAHVRLRDHAHSRGLTFLSTPFDEQSADFLETLGMGIFKIPSGEITNLPFLRHIAGKNKPIILSTGMCCLGEVEAALEALGAAEVTLLHCVSKYPADPADLNLRAMETLRQAFGRPVGFSDHSLGIDMPIAAVALGAVVIEKHLTLDCSLPGPDHRASLEPAAFKAMVASIRRVEEALGDGRKHPVPGEREVASVARKSIVAARDLPAGTVLSLEMLAMRRPGTGLSPAMFPQVLGRKTLAEMKAGALLDWSLLG